MFTIMLPNVDFKDFPIQTLTEKKSITFPIEAFPIQIRSLTGKETTINVHYKMFVSELKDMIEKMDQTPFNQQRLVYDGKQLEDDRTLDYYHIKQDTVVHIILRIRGGMFHETSARKDYDLIQYACAIQTIEDLEEKINLLKCKI
jgi:hypothetical protein